MRRDYWVVGSTFLICASLFAGEKEHPSTLNSELNARRWGQSSWGAAEVYPETNSAFIRIDLKKEFIGWIERVDPTGIYFHWTSSATARGYFECGNLTHTLEKTDTLYNAAGPAVYVSKDIFDSSNWGRQLAVFELKGGHILRFKEKFRLPAESLRAFYDRLMEAGIVGVAGFEVPLMGLVTVGEISPAWLAIIDTSAVRCIRRPTITDYVQCGAVERRTYDARFVLALDRFAPFSSSGELKTTNRLIDKVLKDEPLTGREHQELLYQLRWVVMPENPYAPMCGRVSDLATETPLVQKLRALFLEELDGVLRAYYRDNFLPRFGGLFRSEAPAARPLLLSELIRPIALKLPPDSESYRYCLSLLQQIKVTDEELQGIAGLSQCE